MPSLPYVADSVFAATVGESITVASPDDIRDHDLLYAIICTDTRPTLAGGTVPSWTTIAQTSTTIGNDRKLWVLRRAVHQAVLEPDSYVFDVSGTGVNYAYCVAIIVVRGGRHEWVRSPMAVSDTVVTTDTGAYTFPEISTTSSGANDFTPAAASGGEYTDQPFLALSFHMACMDTAVTGKTGGAPSGYTLIGYTEADGGGSGFNTFLEVATYAATDPTTLPANVWTGTADDATSEYTIGYVLIPPGVPHPVLGREPVLAPIGGATVTATALGTATAAGTAVGARTVTATALSAAAAAGTAVAVRTVVASALGTATSAGVASAVRTVVASALGAATAAGAAVGVVTGVVVRLVSRAFKFARRE